MIKTRNLSKQYGEYPALNSISFEIIREHGITALLGPNGAGKTTCMRLLTGYLSPSGGSIEIDGQTMSDQTRNEIAAKVGYLPETTPLYPEMLVCEYLRFIGLAHGVAADKIQHHMDDMIETMQLSSHLNAPIGALSKGFRQRVGLAGTLIHRPKYIILDEPTSGLDPNQIAGIRALIKTLGKKYTLILSTHILQEVEELCDRAIIIHRGSVVADQKLSSLQKGKTTRLVASGTDLQQQIEAIPGVSDCHLLGYEGKLTASQGGSKTLKRLKTAGAFAVYSIGYKAEPEQLFAELAKRSLKNDWQIRSFRELTRSLEDIFMELTQGGSLN